MFKHFCQIVQFTNIPGKIFSQKQITGFISQDTILYRNAVVLMILLILQTIEQIFYLASTTIVLNMVKKLLMENIVFDTSLVFSLCLHRMVKNCNKY